MKNRFKYLAVIVVSLIVYSCKSAEERNKEKLTEAVKQTIQDHAFKSNQKISLLEISGLSYKMIGQNSIDTLRLIELQNKVEYYTKLCYSYMDLAKSKINLAKLTFDIGSNDVGQMHKDDAIADNNKAKLYNDSARNCLLADSVIKAGIVARKNDNKDFFRTKYLLKATIGGNNILDTLIMVFDKDFKKIDISNN